MKTDQNPSIVGMLFTTPKALKKFIKEVDGKHGMRVRFGIPVDISIPLDDENYEKSVNYLKQFTSGIIARFLKINFPFRDTIMKNLKSKTHLEEFDYDKLQASGWSRWQRHPLLFSGFTPLFVDTKYKEDYNEIELRNLERLKSFETDNYMTDLDLKIKAIHDEIDKEAEGLTEE